MSDRSTQLFLSTANALIRTLDERSDLFVKERPFLVDSSSPLEVLSFPEEREEVETKIHYLLLKLGVSPEKEEVVIEKDTKILRVLLNDSYTQKEKIKYWNDWKNLQLPKWYTEG